VDNLPADYAGPAHEPPRYEERAYEEPVYEEPVYEEPAYEEPAYAEPAPAEPTYAPPPAHEPPRPHEPPPAYVDRPTQVQQPSAAPPPRPVAAPPEPQPAALEDDEYLDDYDYPYRYPEYDEPRRSSNGPLMLIGFGALGIAALLAGILLSGVFAPSAGVGRATPTPTATATTGGGAGDESPLPTDEGSAAASESPIASDGPPVQFEDGFTAEVEPCATQEIKSTGCAEPSDAVRGDRVDFWVGFENAKGDDVIGLTLVDRQSGEMVPGADASLELSEVGCGDTCRKGYLNFWFSQVDPGDYTVRVNRNGAPAAEADFSVTG
jgi:hypothetical protein